MMKMQNWTTIKLEEQPGVWRVTINRPEVLNALNATVLGELSEMATLAAERLDVRVVVIAGAGDKAFVAGADISVMAKMSAVDAVGFARRGQILSQKLEALPQIVVARVQGFALGGGCELAMACDIVVASTKAKFGQPEVGLGLIPGFGGTQRLARRVGLPLAIDMLCANRILSGDEALRAGLVARLCDPEKLDEEIGLVIKGVLKSGPYATTETKRLVRDSYAMSLAAGLAAEAASFGNCFSLEESREGMAAFLEKRSAKFTPGS